ncbi:MAG: septal ring lytic transglycosylase RlpA family protein [Thiohalocapsa sp.]|jgi:rare lipoprotein A|uniref:septal ring lytic transglycosylase RlpA family protein n=1 Tax=Thiohalocapsa sp. TaxID=2497641 RepID=UPI0025F9E575|nr:septal ring lytic transglycosylase RlpA family protein [Thiohalocapsa sp.]MCG6940735.1 septal ring lytic transglycosylase RlpA family protein [Thiohalocapsa sp.]
MMKLLIPAPAAALLALLSLPFGAADAGQVQTGIASYYHDSLNGNRTASGQIYDKNKMSAAHKSLPLGSRVRVTDKRTGKSIVVRINDRGPFVKGRIIDLSHRAAEKLGIIRRGITRVQVEVLSEAGGSGA